MMENETSRNDDSVRIAMWSGPRNISTAMMRSWDARGDCVVSDEPLYGHYLSTLNEEKRREHPAYEAVMESQGVDCDRVIHELTGEVPNGKCVWYQKHMAHHLTKECKRDWILQLTNAFLIRNSAKMAMSFDKVIPNPRPEDLGLPQQLELFERVYKETGEVPAVVDSESILSNPVGMLNTLCEYLRVPFDRGMLSWQSGPRETDGVWASHWYGRVNQTTGFAKPAHEQPNIPKHLLTVVQECEAIESQLRKYALKPYAPGWIDKIRHEQSKLCLRSNDHHIHARIRYGSEPEDWGASENRCRDCGVAHGEIHVFGCDIERCIRCDGQACFCDCSHMIA
ncbi:MAG: HAD family hydrolase [Phycisphaerales bacterium]